MMVFVRHTGVKAIAVTSCVVEIEICKPLTTGFGKSFHYHQVLQPRCVGRRAPSRLPLPGHRPAALRTQSSRQLHGPAPEPRIQPVQRRHHLRAPALYSCPYRVRPCRARPRCQWRFGRGTVQLAAALGPKGGGAVPWKGQAAWRTPAYTTRLEDLMIVK